MNKENRIHSQENQRVDEVVREINTLVPKLLPKDYRGKRVDPALQKMRERWIINTSIVRVLSKFLCISKVSVVDDLASRTTGSSADKELKIAVHRGIDLLGDNFEDIVVHEIRNRLNSGR